MAQYLVPTSDTATGSWTTTPLWSKVDDDSSANPTGDGVTITSNNNTFQDTADFALSSGTDPSLSTGHILRARWNRSQDGGHAVYGTLQLWQGTPGTGTLIATLTSANPIEVSETEDTYTLSGTEANNITDYTALSLRVIREGGVGGPAGGRESLIVELIELEIPSALTNYTLTAESGSLTITGSAANLEYHHEVQGASGSFTWTGTTANLEYHHVIAANAGSYTWTGSTANLEYNRVVVATTGSFAITGSTALTEYHRVFAADSGTYTITGSAVTLVKGINLPANSGSFSLAGSTANLEYHHVLAAQSGTFTWSGSAATLTVTGAGPALSVAFFYRTGW